jgi:hypothetical protein
MKQPRIWKYTLEMLDRQALRLPKNSRILTAQMQEDFYGRIQLWALVDASELEGELVDIYIIGTGNPFEPDPEELKYINTVQVGSLVWHVFSSPHR